MSGSPPQQESKHTPLDEAAIEADAKRWRSWFAFHGQKARPLSQVERSFIEAVDHIDSLAAELRRTRRLLEAGERLAEATSGHLYSGNRGAHKAADAWKRCDDALSVYQEAAKPQEREGA